MNPQSLTYISDYYAVPARMGGRVVYDYPGVGPRGGTITGAQNAHVLVRLDGEKRSLPYHPTWGLTYV
ncbi:MAG: hypothetical protein GY794_16165 [bacterium]|nr:hypothetical protein [bacterium]